MARWRAVNSSLMGTSVVRPLAVAHEGHFSWRGYVDEDRGADRARVTARSLSSSKLRISVSTVASRISKGGYEKLPSHLPRPDFRPLNRCPRSGGAGEQSTAQSEPPHPALAPRFLPIFPRSRHCRRESGPGASGGPVPP